MKPKLPPIEELSPVTKAWWASLDPTSGVCKTWTTEDWWFALDTALIHSQVWGGNTDLAAELRQRLQALGVTASARERSGIKLSATKEGSVDTARNRAAQRRARAKVQNRASRG